MPEVPGELCRTYHGEQPVDGHGSLLGFHVGHVILDHLVGDAVRELVAQLDYPAGGRRARLKTLSCHIRKAGVGDGRASRAELTHRLSMSTGSGASGFTRTSAMAPPRRAAMASEPGGERGAGRGGC